MRKLLSTALVAAMLASPAAAQGIIVDLPYLTFPEDPPQAPLPQTATPEQPGT